MSKRVLLIFTLIFICLISLSTVCALDMDSNNLNANSNPNLDSNLNNNLNVNSNSNFNTNLNNNLNNNLDNNLDSYLNNNLNNNIDNSTQELDLSPKNFKALSSSSSIGGGPK